MNSCKDHFDTYLIVGVFYFLKREALRDIEGWATWGKARDRIGCLSHGRHLQICRCLFIWVNMQAWLKQTDCKSVLFGVRRFESFFTHYQILRRVLIMAKTSADNILYKCIECHRHRVIKNGVDGSSCNYCGGVLIAMGVTNLPTSKEYKKSESIGEIKVKVGADVSDALKGFKAIQRETRKATQSLKEFEQAYNDTKSIADECGVSSQELLAVLSKGRGELHE